MSTFIPAAILMFLGALLAVLGLFVAGSPPLILTGLAAIFGSGILTLVGDRS